MRNLRMAGVALAVIVLAAACQAAMKNPEPEPEPTPTPTPPGIEGTWAGTNSYVEDGQAFTEVMLLTFVGERFIESFEQRDASGAVTDDSSHQGGWSATETMIQKKWYDGEHGAVDKKYYWVDDEHGILFVEHWTSDGPESQFTRLERVPNALPLTDLFGTWSYLNMYNNERWTLAISPDGSFMLTSHGEKGSTVTGVGVPDLENYFINLTGLMEQDAGSSEPVTLFDGVGRIAFAPGTTDGGIRVSPWFDESPIAEQIEKDSPYGAYWMLFRKDAATE